ncbi:hypothetical protein [Sphingomonas xanthus]|uniref:Uncharacterized protein n=1 Tax=Sphingomonas xanthus TaxID=2594473 RepID=A0A516ISW0_9SPHN|nr:hypothetical protein [Sphingomonas xanthus]QDP19991.1 hypothetical protein FMM02_08500 [Sphingomonas xanthus]
MTHPNSGEGVVAGMIQKLASLPLLALALVACQQEDPNNFAIDEGNALNGSIETLPIDESSPNNDEARADAGDNVAAPSPPPGDGTSAPTIPAQYRGRWGMTVNDCDPSRSDAKGLMTVGEKTLTFYESRATLKEQRPAIATSFSGRFAFTGEGQKWERVITFTRTGDTLKRADEEGSFTYKRCA